MGFIEDIKKGLPGLRLSIPQSWQLREEHERRAVLADTDHRVGWHLCHAPWRFDLREAHDDVLRRDIEGSARQVFDDQYVQIGTAEGAEKRPPPRTSDPAWSPVIEVERVSVGGAPALRVVRRLAYEPRLEAVLGSLLVPLATGMCEITAFSRSTETGYRESMLLDLALQQHRGEDRMQVARRLGQRHFDDPQHDGQYANHPLTLVRAALRWLIGSKEDVIRVAAPMSVPEAGEVELASTGCIITPPPRYLLMPPGAVPVPRTMSVLSRVRLEAGENPLVMDVWRLTDVTITGPDPQGKLLELVHRNAGEWEKQGARDVQIDVTPLPKEGDLVQVETRVRMQVEGGKMQSVARWLVDDEGRVFRIAVGAPGLVRTEDLLADAAAAAKSFRKLLTPQHTAWLTSDLRLRPRPPALQ